MSPVLTDATRNGAVRLAGSVLLAVALLTSASSAAAEHAGHAAALSPQTYKELTRVHDLMGQEQYAAAEKMLQELIPQLASKGYEKAVALQTLAHLQAARNRYPQAAHSLRESLALDMLPGDVQQQARYDLAQLYLAADAPGEAVSVLETWFRHTDQPAADAYFLLGHAYVQLHQYRKAIAPLERAIDAVEAADEVWYQTLLAAHYELAAYQRCAGVLEKMVRLFPDRDYWQQLAGVYLALKQDGRALTTLELAYRQDRLSTEQDLLQLAELLLGQGIPFKAAKLLETEMERDRIAADARNLELLGSAWAAARERDKAVAAYQRAMRAGADVAVGLYLAQLYVEDERWREAAGVLESTLKRHGLSQTGDAWLLLGVAHYETGALEQARSAFAEAARYEQARAEAQTWLAHLEEQ